MSKPNCYTCIHRQLVPGSSHSSCANIMATVTATPHGIRMGWFHWPWNFDPNWLLTRTGYEEPPKAEPPAPQHGKLERSAWWLQGWERCRMRYATLANIPRLREAASRHRQAEQRHRWETRVIMNNPASSHATK